MPDAPLEQLARQARKGDADAFVQLMAVLKEPLYRTAYAFLRREDAALRAIEDASCNAFLHIRQLRNPEYAATWVTRILINECIRELRREKRTLPLDAAGERPAPGQDNLDLRDAVERLPVELRAVISVRYFCGMTVPETAGLLGLPEGTVKTRLRKALSILRLELEV